MFVLVLESNLFVFSATGIVAAAPPADLFQNPKPNPNHTSVPTLSPGRRGLRRPNESHQRRRTNHRRETATPGRGKKMAVRPTLVLPAGGATVAVTPPTTRTGGLRGSLLAGRPRSSSSCPTPSSSAATRATQGTHACFRRKSCATS